MNNLYKYFITFSLILLLSFWNIYDIKAEEINETDNNELNQNSELNEKNQEDINNEIDTQSNETTDETVQPNERNVELFIENFYISLQEESFIKLKTFFTDNESTKFLEDIQTIEDFKLIDYVIEDMQMVNEKEYFVKIEVKTNKGNLVQHAYIFYEDNQFKISFDKFIDKVIQYPSIFSNEQLLFKSIQSIKNGDWSKVPVFLFDEKEIEENNITLYSDEEIKEILAKGTESEEYKNLTTNKYYSLYLTIYENPYLLSKKMDSDENESYISSVTKYAEMEGFDFDTEKTFTYSFGSSLLNSSERESFILDDGNLKILKGTLNSFSMLNAMMEETLGNVTKFMLNIMIVIGCIALIPITISFVFWIVRGFPEMDDENTIGNTILNKNEEKNEINSKTVAVQNITSTINEIVQNKEETKTDDKEPEPKEILPINDTVVNRDIVIETKEESKEIETKDKEKIETNVKRSIQIDED